MKDETLNNHSTDLKGAGASRWFDVLEGLSDEDLAEINAIVAQPVRLAHRNDRGADGSALG